MIEAESELLHWHEVISWMQSRATPSRARQTKASAERNTPRIAVYIVGLIRVVNCAAVLVKD